MIALNASVRLGYPARRRSRWCWRLKLGFASHGPFPRSSKRGRWYTTHTHTKTHTNTTAYICSVPVFLAMATCTSWVFACVPVCVLQVASVNMPQVHTHKHTDTHTQTSASQKDNDTWRTFTVSWQLTYVLGECVSVRQEVGVVIAMR